MTPAELRKPLPPRERDRLMHEVLDDLDALVWGRGDIDTIIRLSSLANVVTAGIDIEKLESEVFDPILAQAKASCEQAVIGCRASGYMVMDRDGLLALCALAANLDRMLARLSSGTMARMELRARELCGEAHAAGLAL